MGRVTPSIAPIAVGLLAIAATSCTEPSCPGSGSSDICAGPPYGFARIRGLALDGSGDPIVGKPAGVACGSVVGTYDDVTDSEGRFEMLPVYGSLPDSNLVPLPPRASDGSFLITCDVGIRLSHDEVLERRGVPVRFFPVREAVIATEVSLEASGP
jgi:hypothetical protein